MEKHMGPYRATKLWNDVIRTFRQGMPVSRHRRYMKSYEDSFSAAEAIDWLHAQLQVNPNFGPAVTRAQTLQLLEKFQKARVFDDVRGGKRQETIADNGRLYRFSHVSPAKSRTPARSSRTPLATRSSVNTERTSVVPPTKLDFGKEAPSDVKPLSNCHLMTSSRLTVEEVEEIWKNMTLDSLQKALQLHSLDEILDSDFVNAQQIIHNMTHVNKNGVVCNIEKEDQLPYWVLSAMRCLAHWPNKVEDNLPDYPGFERDVFKVVKDYFEGLAEPLLTFSMYEVFTNVFVCAENVGRPRAVMTSSGLTYGTTSRGYITSFASVENLLMDLTMNGVQEDETLLQGVNNLNSAFHPAMSHNDARTVGSSNGARSCDPRVNGAHPQLRRCNTSRDMRRERSQSVYSSKHSLGPNDTQYFSSSDMRRNPSSTSLALQADRLETSFGVDNGEPRTHVRGKVRSSADPGYSSLYDMQSRAQSATGILYNRGRYTSSVSIETHYGEEESYLQQEQKCLSTNDVSRMVPYPENGLARHRQHGGRSSQASMSESVEMQPDDHNHYGYTVVLSTTPKSDNVRARHRSASASTYHEERDHWHHRERVHSDHDYHKPAPKAAAPPPYIPPPSYQTYHKQAPSEHSSHSSYETAPSRPETPGSLAPEDLYGDHRGVLSPLSKNRVIDALRICCLLLPPPNRRKLHLLLRLMVKMSENVELNVDDSTGTRKLVHQTFTRCILRSAEEADFDEMLSLRLVAFMMDNYSEIMKVPEDQKLQIEERIAYLRRSKVSVEEFERQRMTTSQQALNRLLEDIVNDKTMTDKDRKRRLKQFQKAHPDVYAARFPPSESAPVNNVRKPRIKPALLSRPLLKLKSFRI